jgi:hypothetical protein
MSLGAATVKSLPAEGKITAGDRNAAGNKTMLITAIYADKGGNNIKPLSGTGSISLRNAALTPADKDTADGINVMEFNNTKFALLNGNSGWIAFHNINLKYITSVELQYGIQTPLGKGYVVELRMDKPDGQKLGEVLISSGAKPGLENKANIRVGTPVDGVHHIYFAIRKADASENNPMALSTFRFIAQ